MTIKTKRIDLNKKYAKRPIPLGAIVLYNGDKYLIEECNVVSMEYSLIGHKQIDSGGLELAWVDISKLKILSEPTLKSLRWLREALMVEE